MKQKLFNKIEKMSVLVYAESWKGTFRKSTFEAVSYANETANLLGTDVIALSFGEVSDDELSKLGNYGANKVLSASSINKGDSRETSNFFAEYARQMQASLFLQALILQK